MTELLASIYNAGRQDRGRTLGDVGSEVGILERDAGAGFVGQSGGFFQVVAVRGENENAAAVGHQLAGFVAAGGPVVGPYAGRQII